MKQADFIPRPGMALVKELARGETTKGGILLPDNVEEDSSVKKGHLVDNEGFVVFFGYDATKIQFEDEEGPLLLVAKADILGGDAEAMDFLTDEHKEDC